MSKQDACKFGHDLMGENLYISPKGARGCRRCRSKYANNSHKKSPEQQRIARERWREKHPDYHKYHWLMRTYDMSREEFDRKLEEQNHQCGVCRRLMDDPQVDHDHVTGENRDLLCGQCNRGIGQFHDDVLIVEQALAYLQRWKHVID